MVDNEKELGRQEGETDASFFIKLFDDGNAQVVLRIKTYPKQSSTDSQVKK